MIWKYRRLIFWRWALCLAITYFPTYLVDIVAARHGVPVPPALLKLRFMLLMAWTALYGFYRAVQFHPVFRKGYLQLLTVSPWDSRRPFPLGPPYIVWVDIVVVTVLALLCHINGVFSPMWPAVVCLLAYLVLWSIGLLTREFGWFVAVALFIMPFSAYPHRDVRIGLAVLIGIYIWFYIGFRKQFKSFPWNTPYWQADIVEQLRRGFAKKDIVGWLNQTLKLYEPQIKMNLVVAFAFSTLATWWFHVIVWLEGEPDNLEFAQMVSFLGTVVLILVRLAMYRVHSCRSPIGLWGRLCTFRWIIPRYDVVYLAPACMGLTLILIPKWRALLGLSEINSYEVLVFVELMLAMAMPPRRRDWWLTGAHRIVEKSKLARLQSKNTVPVGPKATWMPGG